MYPKIESSLGIIGESSILAIKPDANPKMNENKTEYAICFLPTLILVRILLDFKNILIINLPSPIGNTFSSFQVNISPCYSSTIYLRVASY